jgi:hypothetical protein
MVAKKKRTAKMVELLRRHIYLLRVRGGEKAYIFIEAAKSHLSCGKKPEGVDPRCAGS